MRRPPLLGTLAGSVLATALLTSCGIRLPIHTQEVQRIPVSIDHPAPEPTGDPDVLVWLVADEYHTGMVFPYDWLLESGFIPPADFGKPRFVVMSWGNTDAYSERGVGSPLKWCEVLFTPTPSVMELIAVDWDVAEVCPNQRIWRKLVPRDRGPALADFLNQCGVRGPDGRPKVVRPSSWGKGVQLEGHHPYFIPRVCNVWTAQTIECLGGRINPWFGLTADGLVRQAEKQPNDFEKIWSGTGLEKRTPSAVNPRKDSRKDSPGF
jgi:hypothetical protein